MAAGKRGFGFRRFKKSWRAQATRAKAHRLEQNWQSLATKRNALTTEPRLQTGHNIDWNIAVYEVEMQKRKLQPRKHVGECCCYSPTLALGSAMEIWLGVINEMCLWGLNLSSSQDSEFNYELALLQHAMNAVGVCSPREWKPKHSGMIISECLH